MSKLPILSGNEVIKKLERIGYENIRQKGSHVRLKHKDNPARKPITVPLHRIIKPGLLCKIIKEANLTVESFTDL